MEKKTSGAETCGAIVGAVIVNAAVAAGLGFAFPHVMSFTRWFVAVAVFWALANILKRG